MATDAGDSLMKMEFGEVPIIRVTDRITLGEWLGRKEISILGITDPHLAETVLKKAEGSDPGTVPGR
jgi:ribosomal protein L7Ae-like RNA K-turn-binding protein